MLANISDFDFPQGKRILGEGQFSQVRRVRHKKTGKLYALKEVRLSDYQKRAFA